MYLLAKLACMELINGFWIAVLSILVNWLARVLYWALKILAEAVCKGALLLLYFDIQLVNGH